MQPHPHQDKAEHCQIQDKKTSWKNIRDAGTFCSKPGCLVTLPMYNCYLRDGPKAGLRVVVNA